MCCHVALYVQQATAIAIHMVKDWGMSEKVGLRTHDGNNSGLVVVNELSPSTNDQIDSEIKRIMTVSVAIFSLLSLF
jgi:ATP-dependent metalloprotease